MRELLYYFTLNETILMSHLFYFIGIALLLCLLILFFKRITILNLIIIPIIAFSFILGLFFNEMPKQLIKDIETGYNNSTFDSLNQNPERQKVIKIKIDDGMILVNNFYKKDNCAKNSIDWNSSSKCVIKTSLDQIDCSVLDVNQCVALTYEKYQY